MYLIRSVTYTITDVYYIPLKTYNNYIRWYMPAFEVDYSGKELIFATHPVNALDDDEAEDFTLEYVKETYPELLDVQIESIRKLKD